MLKTGNNIISSLLSENDRSSFTVLKKLEMEVKSLNLEKY